MRANNNNNSNNNNNHYYWYYYYYYYYYYYWSSRKVKWFKCNHQRMSSGALKVAREGEKIQAKQGGIHGNPVSRNHPRVQSLSGTVTLKGVQWNIVT